MHYTIGINRPFFGVTTGYARTTKQAIRILRKLKKKWAGYHWAGVWKRSHGEHYYEDLRKELQ